MDSPRSVSESYADFLSGMFELAVDRELSSKEALSWFLQSGSDIFRYRELMLPKYTPDTGEIVAPIRTTADLLYGIYIPVATTACSVMCDGRILAKRDSYQNRNGYINFHIPLPMYLMPNILITLCYQTLVTKTIAPPEICKFLAPVLLVGFLKKVRRGTLEQLLMYETDISGAEIFANVVIVKKIVGGRQEYTLTEMREYNDLRYGETLY